MDTAVHEVGTNGLSGWARLNSYTALWYSPGLASTRAI